MSWSIALLFLKIYQELEGELTIVRNMLLRLLLLTLFSTKPFRIKHHAFWWYSYFTLVERQRESNKSGHISRTSKTRMLSWPELEHSRYACSIYGIFHQSAEDKMVGVCEESDREQGSNAQIYTRFVWNLFHQSWQSLYSDKTFAFIYATFIVLSLHNRRWRGCACQRLSLHN